MNFIHNIWLRVKTLFRKRRLDADMDEEMRLHLELLTEHNIQAGMSPEEARYAAQRKFGGVEQLKERGRDERGGVWLEQILKDTGFVMRSLNRARGFTVTILSMLVLGIGITTVVFNLTAWLLVFAQPYPHPDELYVLGFKDKHGPSPFIAGTQWEAYREQTAHVFSEFATVTRDLTNVVIEGDPVVANLIGTSTDCFRTLGVTPVMGRGFLPEEYRKGADNVVVISDLFWRKYFHADPAILSRKVLIDQQPCLVIGVLAAKQLFPSNFEGDVYRPLVPLKLDYKQPFAIMAYVIGRLRPGVPLAQAKAALVATKLPTIPAWATEFLTHQEPILIRPTDVARPETYWVLAIAAVLLYAITCLNATNLMLVRLLGRRRELGIRLALGATRWQIVRLLAIESAGLALMASLMVALVARLVFPSLFALIRGNDSSFFQSFWDVRTLGCIGALSLLASVLALVVPVWRLLKAEINPRLKEGGAAAGEGRSVGRLKMALVIFQAAFAVILLSGTGLMVRSFERLQHVDLGFEAEGRVNVSIALPDGYELKPKARLELFERLQQRLGLLPGVHGVSFGQYALLTGVSWGMGRMLMPDGSTQPVENSFVGAEFPKVAGVVLKQGRWFSDKPGVYEAVINESLAKVRFGNEDPIGKSFLMQGFEKNAIPVVGVVGDVRETVRAQPALRFYVPNWVWPPEIDTLLLKLDRDPPKEFEGKIRHVIYEVDPKLIVASVSSVHGRIDSSMEKERFAFTVLKGLSMVALVLAIIGLFSVIAFAVDNRMKEFGIRLALGAQPGNLLRLVLLRGLMTTMVGIVLGTAGALALTRFMESLLFETKPYDLLVYLGVALVLMAAAVLACWLPARRAATVDPIVALRSE